MCDVVVQIGFSGNFLLAAGTLGLLQDLMGRVYNKRRFRDQIRSDQYVRPLCRS